MIPFITIGGIFLALGYTVASLSNNVQGVFNSTGIAGWFLVQIGVAGLMLMVPVPGVYIAYAIADRPGLTPGFILSHIIQQGNILRATGDVIGLQGGSIDANYLGAIVAGFFASIVARQFKQRDVPELTTPMVPMLPVPAATTAMLAPVILFVLGVPISIANAGLTKFLNNMRGGGQAILLGGILGAMMTADMGDPINKVTYVFPAGLISEGVTVSMTAVVIAGMVPPIDLALSDLIASQKYATRMYENIKSGVFLGSSPITGGTIPYTAADPIHVIPNVIAGSTIVDAAPMAPGVNVSALHDGIFVVPLSSRPLMFAACILLGSIVIAVIATAIKPNSDAKMAVQSSDD